VGGPGNLDIVITACALVRSGSCVAVPGSSLSQVGIVAPVAEGGDIS
jgi:hypothetical protein